MDDEKKEDLRHEDEKQEQDTGADNYEFPVSYTHLTLPTKA